MKTKLFSPYIMIICTAVIILQGKIEKMWTPRMNDSYVLGFVGQLIFVCYFDFGKQLFFY